MSEPFDSSSFQRELSLYADGELDSVSAERLQRRLTKNPQAAHTLRQMQRLNTTARRVIHDQTPPVSEALRDRLQSMVAAQAKAQISPAKPAQTPRIRTAPFWWPALLRTLAASLLLSVGMWIGHRWTRPTLSGANGTAITAEVIPAADISTAEEVHGYCSRLADGLHQAGYPTDLAPLSSAVQADLHSDHPYPDLTAIGFRYRGAGPCGRSLPGTIHLLYRSMQPGSVQAVSVFVQSWHDQYSLEAGRLYCVSVASSPFPMLAWRTDRVVYFLLADDAGTVQKAAELIRRKTSARP